MMIKKKIKWKLWQLKRNQQWKKERFEILDISKHTKEHSRATYTHTAICKTDREVKDFDLLACLVSEKVGYNTLGYVYCGLNSILFLEDNEYQISWDTWDSCD